MPIPAIKICGLNTPIALDAAIAARADYAGLVFYPPSPRHVTMADVALLEGCVLAATHAVILRAHQLRSPGCLMAFWLK